MKTTILNDLKNKPQALGVLNTAFECALSAFSVILFDVRLAVGVDRPRLLGEDCDCEEPRPATLFCEATVECFH
jgi:hypothetical protein